MTMPLAGNLDLLIPSVPSKSQIYRNDYFSILFDTKTGRLDIARVNGNILLSGSVIRANTSLGLISTGDTSFGHSVKSSRISDRLGEGVRIIINSSGSYTNLDFNLGITLYKNHHAVFIEVDCNNRSSKKVNLRSIEPICANNETGGALLWPRTSKLLTNGPMYYDPGTIFDFSYPDNNLRQSWWNIGLFSGYNQEGLAIGAVENQTAQGRVSVRRNSGDNIGLVAQSVFGDGFILGAGKKVRSNQFVLYIGPDPYIALEGYADLLGRLNKARTNSIVNGWCNWFFTYEHITEEEVIRNAEFASRVLKPYGLEYIQVDEGYQKWRTNLS